jgi:chemotaxis protein CheZ
MTSAADDFDALFDEVAAQRTETLVATAPAPAVESAPVQTVEPALATAAEHKPDTTPVNPADKPMFERLGGIVRLLHDSLRELGYDRSLSNVATQITDAQGRLEYIATLTEQAANKVLNEIDGSMPEQDTLSKNAKDMEGRWAQLFEGKLSIEEFKTLAGDSKEFATTVAAAAETQKARLLEIMMAQDFQDITGQLIKKIVAITHTAETELAQLLRDNAPPEMKAALAEAKPVDSKPVDLMQGPSVPTAAMAQDDVDSLLADLGF